MIYVNKLIEKIFNKMVSVFNLPTTSILIPENYLNSLIRK